jgi:L-aminopeptidase/D-esterase-like protein
MPALARFAVAAVLLPALAWADASRPRARDLGVPFDGEPGPLNAITDVAGVTVGHETIVRGEGSLVVGEGPVRTGVTAIFPKGRDGAGLVPAGWFSLNGNGELTGTAWLEESGFLDGPVMLTNTHSVGTVRDATIAWRVEHGGADMQGYFWSLPVVGETWDGHLNDINGFHVKPEHVARALEAAAAGPVAEGAVGGGTGMICFEFKGGIGTASRRLPERHGGHTVGVLVQCNCGRRPQLTVAGVPVGRLIPERPAYGEEARETGSILIVIATDAPLLPHQLERLARRATMGLARTGSTSGDGSGDLFLAFSTVSPAWDAAAGLLRAAFRPNENLDPLFEATVQATEEAIVNAMVAADTMIGADGRTAVGLSHERLRAAMDRAAAARLSP